MSTLLSIHGRLNNGNCITNREYEVLQLIAFESTSQEIAKELYISNHTVISHRKNLMEKLDVKNTAGLVRRGFELGLLIISTSHAMAS